jgi:hypothetical protein
MRVEDSRGMLDRLHNPKYALKIIVLTTPVLSMVCTMLGREKREYRYMEYRKRACSLVVTRAPVAPQALGFDSP